MKKQGEKMRVTKQDKEFAKRMGNRIREVRTNKVPKITIEDLAHTSGVSGVTISNIETGKIPLVSISTIRRIADALNCPVSIFTGETDLVKLLELLDMMKRTTGN